VAEVELALRELLRRLCMHLMGARRLATLLAERCPPPPPERVEVTVSLRPAPARGAPARRWMSQRTHYATTHAGYQEDATTQRALRACFVRRLVGG
jgi:hypothetical protein